MMNEVVKRAYEIQEKAVEAFKNQYLPELEIGENCDINDVWDGDKEITGVDEETCTVGDKGSYSYQISDTGEEGDRNVPVWINYEFEVIEVKENFLDTVVKITDIQLL